MYVPTEKIQGKLLQVPYIVNLKGDNDSWSIHSTTRRLLGAGTGEPPSTFLIDGKAVRKQDELAEILSQYYHNKVMEIKNSLPGVNWDPLRTLRRALDRWRHPGGRKV